MFDSILAPFGVLPDDPEERARREAAAARLPELQNSHGGSFVSGLVNSAASGFTLPGDVWSGQVDPKSDEALERSLDTAGLAMTGGLGGVAKKEGEAVLGSGPIRAYHGSPHDFDRFDISKIGTGEGAQVYGHGLYFAEAEPTAAYYRQQLSPSGTRFIVDGQDFGALAPSDLRSMSDVAQAAFADSSAPRPVKSALLNAHRELGGADAEAVRSAAYEDLVRSVFDPDQRATIRAMVDEAHPTMKRVEERRPGSMYEVAINADRDRFLPWDAPVGSQHLDAVKAAGIDPNRFNVRGPDGKSMYAAGGGVSEREAAEAARDFQRGYDRYRPQSVTGEEVAPGKFEVFPELPTGRNVYQELGVQHSRSGALPPTDPAARSAWRAGPDKMASEQLRDLGIPGIQYLDQGSRDAGKGTSNFVTFSDDIVSILRKYGIAGLAALPAAGALVPGEPSQ